MTISNLTKMAESSPNGYKTLWEKEKLLVTSIFSFSHSAFKRLVSQGRQKVSLCGNGLKRGKEFALNYSTITQKFKHIYLKLIEKQVVKTYTNLS